MNYSNFDEYLDKNIEDAKHCILEQGHSCRDVKFKDLADMHENLLNEWKVKDFRVLIQSLYEPGLTYWKESLEPGKLQVFF